MVYLIYFTVPQRIIHGSAGTCNPVQQCADTFTVGLDLHMRFELDYY